MSEDCLIFQTSHWQAEQCTECPLPGYLILTCRIPVCSFSDIPEEVWLDLGRALSVACRLVETVTEPERVYVCHYGEDIDQVHFHVFPRTNWLLQEYREAAKPSTDPISGPQVFDWARDTFHECRRQPTHGVGLNEAIQKMKRLASTIL